MNTVTQYPPFLCSVSATIASSQTTSDAVDLAGTTLVGIQLPASLTGTALSFEAATTSGGTYQQVIGGGGNVLSKTVSGGKFLSLDPAEFAGVQFLKIVSDASEGAERTLELITRPV